MAKVKSDNSAVSLTTVLTGDETDAAPAIRTANINGEEYLFDYAALKNRPVFREVSEGTVLLPSTVVEFSEH